MDLVPNSVFGLIAAGAGPHSYRFYEVIAVGSIPMVFIDDIVFPAFHFLDWDKCVVTVKEADLFKIPDIAEDLFNNHKQELLERQAACQKILPHFWDRQTAVKFVIEKYLPSILHSVTGS